MSFIGTRQLLTASHVCKNHSAADSYAINKRIFYRSLRFEKNFDQGPHETMCRINKTNPDCGQPSESDTVGLCVKKTPKFISINLLFVENTHRQFPGD